MAAVPKKSALAILAGQSAADFASLDGSEARRHTPLFDPGTLPPGPLNALSAPPAAVQVTPTDVVPLRLDANGADVDGDDFAGDVSTTGVIAAGGSVAGVLETAGDSDWFKFVVTPGSPIRFTLTSPNIPQLFMAVHNEAGDYLTPFSTTGELIYGFTQPITVFVAVHGFQANGSFATGAYTLQAEFLPDDHGDDAATATPIVVDGAAVTAVNEGGPDQDWFRFDAQGGVPVVFDFQALAPSGINYTIYDRFGREQFGNAAHSMTEYHAFTPDATGTFYLATNGPSATFAIKTAVDDFADDLTTTGVLVIDGPPVSARHDFTGDFDVFSIAMAVAGTYRIEILPADFLHIKLLALYDAAGSLIEHRFATTPGEGLTLHVDAPGQYYVGVEEADGLTTDDNLYQVWAYRVSVDDYGETLATAGSLIVGGGPVNGALDYNEDRDWLRFEAQAGDVLRFELLSNWLGVNFQILNDQGVLWNWVAASEYEGSVFYIPFREGGTYYFAYGDPVGHISNMGTGAYSIDISVVPGESALPGPLAIGTPAQGTLTWAGNNSDTFAFTAVAGQTIRFDVDLDADYWWKLSVWHINQDGVPEYVILEPLAFELPRGYTFGETGEYFVVVTGFQPTTISNFDLGTYTLHANVIVDDAGSDPATAAVLVLDGPSVTATVNYENDVDWFAITVDAGDVVQFNVVHDQSITALNWGDGRPARFDVAGTYFVVVEGRYWEEVGGSYTITATSYADDYRSDVGTSASISVGGPAFPGRIEYDNDADWFSVNLVAGEDYIFNLTGVGDNGYFGENIEFFDSAGAPVATFPGENAASRIFSASTTGVYYVSALATSTGNYTISAALVPPDPLASINTGTSLIASNFYGHVHHGAANVVNVYFAGVGEQFGSEFATGWSAADITRVMTILESFEAYISVDFQATTTLPYADIALLTINDPNNLTLFSRANADVPIPAVAFSTNAPSWTSSALAPGGFGAAVVLNGLGYALGLAFPHSDEGGTKIMRGVTSEIDLGDFDLNQGVHTIMSFNDGWVTSPYGLSPSLAYGWQATPMALDIAALQALYGANTTANSGNTTYVLGDSNVNGAAWRAIWDVGGLDTIAYAGVGATVIDLRQASLDYSGGGGGFKSYVNGVHGGIAIAGGALIENALGGFGADTLTGNAADNVLSGGDGDDTLDGGDGGDSLHGGAGIDNASYATALAGVAARLLSSATNTGDAAGDTYSGIENIRGSAFADVLGGDNSANLLAGGGGNDILQGFDGADTLAGGGGNDLIQGEAGADTILYSFGDGADTIDGGADADTFAITGHAGDSILNATFSGGALTSAFGNTLANVETVSANLLGWNRLADLHRRNGGDGQSRRGDRVWFCLSARR